MMSANDDIHVLHDFNSYPHKAWCFYFFSDMTFFLIWMNRMDALLTNVICARMLFVTDILREIIIFNCII